MIEINKVILMGRFTRDIELKYSQGAEPTAVLKNSIAVGRKFKKDEADFINVTAFGKTAENISKYFKKGSLIAISGRIQTGSYDKNGTRVYTTDIIIDEFEFTGEKNNQQSSAPSETTNGFYEIDGSIDDEDLPF